jgi:hypothetical protein
VIRRILRHLGLPDVVPEMRPSRAPPLPFDPFDGRVSGDGNKRSSVDGGYPEQCEEVWRDPVGAHTFGAIVDDH